MSKNSWENVYQKSPHTGQCEPVKHVDGRLGIIWKYLSDDLLSVKWDDGSITEVEWKELDGYV